MVPISRHAGPLASPGHPAAAQQYDQHPEQAQQQHQHRKSPRHRPVGVGLDREEVVAQPVLVPRDRRADLVFDAHRLGDRGQRLTAEHHHGDQRQRRRQHKQWRQQPVGWPASPDRLGDGPGPGQQRGDRDQPLRSQRRGEHRDHDRDRGRRQSPQRDRAFHQHPGDDDAEGDQRLGPQAVVERQPRGQEHRARGVHRHPVGSQAALARAQPAQHPMADDQPARDPGQRGRQPHPHAGGAHRRHFGQHRRYTSRTAPRSCRSSGSSWRRSRLSARPGRWSGCSRRPTRWRR